METINIAIKNGISQCDYINSSKHIIKDTTSFITVNQKILFNYFSSDYPIILHFLKQKFSSKSFKKYLKFNIISYIYSPAKSLVFLKEVDDKIIKFITTYCKDLEKLSFPNCRINSNHIKSLSTTHFYRLEYLNLEGNLLYLESIKFLSSSKFDKLQSLNLNRIKCGLNGFSLLFKNKQFSSLKTLDLSFNKLSDDGVKALASGELINLTNINLTYNFITEKGVKFLSTGNLKNLEKLILTFNKIKDKGVEHMNESGISHFAFLTELYLNNNLIGNVGCQYLNKFSNLRLLDLSENKISNEGLKFLSTSKLYQLENLDLSINLLKNECGAYLTIENFPKLKI